MKFYLSDRLIVSDSVNIWDYDATEEEDHESIGEEIIENDIKSLKSELKKLSSKQGSLGV